jgi:hypothetical protein
LPMPLVPPVTSTDRPLIEVNIQPPLTDRDPQRIQTLSKSRPHVVVVR